MSEPSIFQKEEELLEFGAHFMEEFGPDTAASSLCPHGHASGCRNHDTFYEAFKRVYTNYKKLFRQTTRLIRLSDRQQLKLDTANQSLQQSQKQLKIRNEFIRSIFSRYMSDEVVESILETPEGLRMGGEKKEVTVMMSDLRGFTAISETFPAETVVTIVNLYLEVMTEIIFKYQGTINGFFGDGILILFGAPISREDDAKRAVACALEMQRAMPKINANNQERGYPKLNMGIGIHTGAVVAGNIGSKKRSHYTVMGSVVNLAARIESYSVGGQILISETTLKSCDSLLRIDDCIHVTPKGIDNTITLHQVSAIGGKYDIQITDQGKVIYQELIPTLPVRFALLSGKHTGTSDHSGEICSLSDSGAKIKVEAPIAPFTNLKIDMYHHNRQMAQALAGKVVHGGSAENPLIEVTFTFVPSEAQKLFQEILKHKGIVPTQQADPAAAVPDLEPASKAQKSRSSVRRNSSEQIILPIKMEDGRVLNTEVSDFSLDGMFLKTGLQKPPGSGTGGSFDMVIHDQPHSFAFEVLHTYQNGIGIRISRDHDIYSVALLDGAFGKFLPDDPK